MSDKNIHVKNISSAKVYISVPATRWWRDLIPGREIHINQEEYDDLSNEYGFINLINGGFLSVRTDDEEKKDSIVAPEKPVLSRDEIKKIFAEKNITKFAKLIPNASPAEKETIANLAVEMNVVAKAFTDLIAKYCEVDVLDAIAKQRAAKEA